MKAVCEHFSAQETPIKTMDFDGFRLEFADWWFNIRPSNTEPYLRFICEARTEEMLQEKVAQACKLLEKRFGAVRS
jgi:phosphomannomutase